MNQRERNREKSCDIYSRMLALAGLLAIMFASASVSRAQSTSPLSSAQKKVVAAEYGRLPLSFEKNEGQADPRVKFLAHGQGYSLSLTRDGALLFLHSGTDPKTQPESDATSQIKLVGANSNPEIVGTDELPGKVNYILGNDPKKWRTNLPTFAQVRYKDVYPGIDLVFYGNQGRLEFDFVVHPGANPNSIQLENLGAQTHALDKSGNITYEYTGGRITLNRPFSYVSTGTVRQEVVSNYAIQKDGRISFRVKHYDAEKTLVIDPTLGYSTFLGGPTGVAPSDVAVDGLGEAIVVGMAGTGFPMTAGAFQAAAQASSTRVPFVMKLNASGTALVYATFLGGTNTALTSEPDSVTAVAADAAGNAYLTGGATNLNFPTTANVFQSTAPCLAVNRNKGVCSNVAAFVTELNPTGSGLVFSTFLGGTMAMGGISPYNVQLANSRKLSGLIFANFQPGEIGSGIAVDSTGVYIGGITNSIDFPVTSGITQPTFTPNAQQVPFVAKLSGGSLIYAALVVPMPFFGLISADGFAIDPSGNAYIAGSTTSNFPTTPGVLQESFGTSSSTTGFCSYVAKTNPSGSALVYATLFACTVPGTTTVQPDVLTSAIAADAAGNAYITGVSTGGGDPATANLPTTPGAYQATCPVATVPPAAPSCGASAFVSKINPTGTALVYSTYLGGESGTGVFGLGLAVNSSGEAVVAGVTTSSSSSGPNTFPTTPDALQTSCMLVTQGCSSGFVTEMSADGSALVYSTYLSGSQGDTEALAVALDGPGNLYVTGGTFAPGFPTTPGAFDTTPPMNDVGFLTKFGNATGGTGTGTGTITIQPTTLPAGGVNLGYFVAFTATGATGTVTWAATGLPTGLTITGGVLSGIPTVAGTFPLQITATDANNNTGSVSVSLLIYPGTTASISLPPCSAAAVGTTLAVNFPNTAVGSSSTQSVCLNNTGSNTLYLDGFISFSLPISPISIASDTCPLLGTAAPSPTNGLSAGQSCQLTFRFQPTAIATYSPSLKILDSGGSQIVNFAAAGVAPPFASFSPAQLNFGNVAVNAVLNQTVTLTNTGTGPLTLNFLGLLFQPPGFSVPQIVCNGVTEPQPTPSPLTINPTQSCAFTVQFGPTTTGPFSAVLSFADNAGPGESNLANTTIFGSTGQVVSLSGTGITAGPPPDFTISASPVTVTAGNGGQSTITIAPLNGFTDAVNLSVAGSPAGVTASFNTNPITGGAGTSTLTLATAATTPTGTSTVTVTGTDTSGSPSHSTTLSLTVNPASGGTPVCGCNKTGPYVDPVALVSSPNSNYTFTDQVNGFVENVNIYAKGVTNALISISGTALGSKLGFSPSGQYFVYENLASSSSTTVQIFNVFTGKMVYSTPPFTFSGTPGSGGEDKVGVVGLSGFSPDNPETSFVYAFQTGQNSVQWELVQLEQNPSTDTVGGAKTSPLTSITSAFWQFSPCGDVVAIVTQPSGFAEIQFIRTADGTQVKDFSGIPAGNITMASNMTQQVATDVSSSGTQTTSQTYTVDDSANNLGCSALNTPPGSNVTVQPTATWTGTGTMPTGSLPAPVTLNFPGVNTPGGQISLTEGNSGALPPAGFGLGNPPTGSVYYDLTESPSSLSFTTPITICINYTGQTFTGQPALFHIVNGVSTPLNEFFVDTANHIVCADTPSLSPFAIFGATGPVSTTTALSSSLNSTVEGQTVTFAAKITPSLVGTPSGTVTFSDGGTVLGTGSLNGSGSASVSTSLLPAGPNSITAAYSGDTYFAGSTSTALALTVTPAPLTITANTSSRRYGAADTAFTVSYSGFVNGDGPGSLSGALTCTAGDMASSPVGTYAINCSGLSSPNYAITYMPGTLTVTKAVLTITANNATKTLNAANPTLGWTASGFVNGENPSVFTATPTCTTTATTSSPVGSYSITCSGANAANYTFTYVPGALKIVYAPNVGHVIQPPINADGTSVFNQGRTVPAKFSVYDAKGVSIGTPGVVTSFFLTGIVSGTVTTTVDNVVDTNNPDTAFRWDPTGQQWIFNITTGNLNAGSTYIYTITLNDGSTIIFQYGLR